MSSTTGIPNGRPRMGGRLVRLSTCVSKGACLSAYDDDCQAGEGKGWKLSC